MAQYFDAKSISDELSLESPAERSYALDMDKSTLTMSKNSKIQGRHMIIEIKCGQMMMNEFTCNDLLRKVKDNCCKNRSGSNGLITYRDCKRMLSDAECTPNIDTRFECILVQLFPVSCIILKNSILVVANEDINIDNFIKNLCRITNLYHLKEYTRKNGEKDSSTYSQYGSLSSTAEENENTSDTTLPFEISLLECCYTTAISHLEMDLIEIEKKFKLVEEMASNNKKYKHISIIIHELKQPVSNLTEIMKGYEELMNELLNSHENMNLLEFSNHNKLYGSDNAANDLVEFPINRDLESLLEYFDQEIENLSKRSRTTYTSLVHLERHINLELSITRNEIMRFELMCSIIGTAFGAGACVSGGNKVDVTKDAELTPTLSNITSSPHNSAAHSMTNFNLFAGDSADVVPKPKKASVRHATDDESAVGSLFNCHVSKGDSNDDLSSPRFDPSLFDISKYLVVHTPGKLLESVSFSLLADVLQKSDEIFCSGKGSRKCLLTLLSNFFRVLIYYKPTDLVPAIYILLNRVCPEYESTELGVGDSLIVKSMAEAYGKSEKNVKAMMSKYEDLGVIASISSCTTQTLVKLPDNTISSVFSQFKAIANVTGKNSNNHKRDIIKKLLISSKKHEVKYIIRFLQQKLRIGIGLNTIFQCVADAFYLTRVSKGDTPNIGDVRTAVNLKLTDTLEQMEMAVRTAITNMPCIEKIIGHLLNNDNSLDLFEHCKISPGIPVRPMLAKPVNNLREIIQSIGGEGIAFTCEYKYDGERIQLHLLQDQTVKLFSRNMESLSEKYPDVIDKFLQCIKDDLIDCIIDCEVVAFDSENRILPFQHLSTRKRKDVNISNIEVQVCLFPFDILYCNGETLVSQSLSKRREYMNKYLVEKEGKLMFTKRKDMDSLDDIDEFLRLAVSESCEGLMIKTLDDNATYEPQRRSNKWLKFKKDYITGMSDSVDLVPIAAFYGKGKRTNVYGSYLLAIYDPIQEIFQGVCKTGTGFTDELLKKLYDTLQEHKIASKSPLCEVPDKMEPDVWFTPHKVWECKAADLSISPVYTAANRLTTNGKGIGLRFPRFLRDRDDKQPVDATTSEQIYDMYKSQFAKS